MSLLPAFLSHLSLPLSHPPSPRPLLSPPVATAANYFEYRPHLPKRADLPIHLPLPSLIPPPRPISLLASDLDGTLLNPAKRIDVANVEAAISLVESGVRFVPATGKSRAGAFRAMGRLGHFLQTHYACTGIFLNGLLVHGADGDVVWERGLTKEEAQVILEEGEKRGLVVLFYAGDRVLVRERRTETDMFIVSHEPVPEAVGDLAGCIKETFVHKALLVDPRGSVRLWRSELENVLKGVGIITQARPDVLEVLPRGGSKGEGFRKLIENLGIPKEETMAIGDGENDLEMIREAGFGVAVSNAVPEMLMTADEVVCGNGEAAVAYAIRKFITKRI